MHFLISLGQAGQVVTEAERDVDKVTRVLPVLQALPAGDFVLGGLMLVVIVLIHGTCMRAITTHVIRRSKRLAQQPSEWSADLLLSGAIALLLSAHLIETGVWTTVLVGTHLVTSWHEAGYFVANTYTTLGYGEVILADPWKMLSPIMAISGLFTFGWTARALRCRIGRHRSHTRAATRWASAAWLNAPLRSFDSWSPAWWIVRTHGASDSH